MPKPKASTKQLSQEKISSNPRSLLKKNQKNASKTCNETATTKTKCAAKKCVKELLKIDNIPLHLKLRHVSAFVDVWNGTNDRTAAVQRLLRAMGATIRSRIHHKVTHVVFHEGDIGNLLIAKDYSYQIVSVEWLDAVKHHSTICPEINYDKYAKPLTYDRITEICQLECDLKSDQNISEPIETKQDKEKINYNKYFTTDISYTQRRLSDKKYLCIASSSGHRIPKLLRKPPPVPVYDLPPIEILPFDEKLQDVIAFVDVWSGKVDRSADVNLLLEAMGATIVHMLNSTVTHCIYHEGRITNLLRANAIGCSVVSLEWLDALKHHPTICPEIYYSMFTMPLTSRRITQICRISEEIILSLKRDFETRTAVPYEIFKKSKSSLPEVPQVESNMEVIEIFPNATTRNPTDNETGPFIDSSIKDCSKRLHLDEPVAMEFMEGSQCYIKLPADDIAAIALSSTFSPERVCINPCLILEPSAPYVAPTNNLTIKPIQTDNLSHNISGKGSTIIKKNFTCTAGSSSMGEVNNNTMNTELYGLPYGMLSNTSNSKSNSNAATTSSMIINVQTEPKSKFIVASYNHIIINDLEKAIAKLGKFNLSKEVCRDTTHVVAENENYFTYDVLKGIARGCWILKYNWISDSYKENKWLPEIDYEITDLCLSVKVNRIQREEFGQVFPRELFKTCMPFYLSEGIAHNWRLKQVIELCSGSVSEDTSKCWLVIGFCAPSTLPSVNKGWVAACIVTSSLQKITRRAYTYKLSREMK